MNTLKTISTQIKSLLGNTYKVIDSYDESDDVSLNGVIAINIQETENLNHGTEKDYRIGVSINGQTLADEDKTRSVIMAMLNYVIRSLNTDTLKANVPGCAGILHTSDTVTSDGDTNNFTVGYDLYCCNVDFTA